MVEPFNVLDVKDLSALDDEQFAHAVAEVLRMQRVDRQENQILYYKPTQPNSLKIMQSTARLLGVGGGNRSSKTTSCLVRWVALATGVMPLDPEVRAALRPKFKGPLRVRVVVESITNTLVPVILPKLKYTSWSGLPPHGGDKGHYGWIPRMCLIDGDWSKSWSEKNRMLTVLCRDPDDTSRIIGKSTIQFNSFDQDPADFASGDFDIVHEDEPPPHAIHRENEARTMSVGGMVMISMTWPDDASIPVDWIYDDIYEPGQPGPSKKPDIEWIELDTMLNTHVDIEGIKRQAEAWDAVTRAVRIKGQPLRFSNRVHPLFSDVWQYWSFPAGKNVMPVDGVCPETGSMDIAHYCHVQEFDHSRSWPVICLIDPHPRKAHMLMWAQINPSDDIDIIAEMQIDGDPGQVKIAVEALEESMGLNVVNRLGDPNMLGSPSGASREIEWRDEFANAGLNFEMADKSEVGRARVNEYLKPDPHTRRPRLIFHRRCVMAVNQMKRFVWDDYRRKEGRDQKQTPKTAHDDYPAMLRYLLNSSPEFRMLSRGAPVIRTRDFNRKR